MRQPPSAIPRVPYVWTGATGVRRTRAGSHKAYDVRQLPWRIAGRSGHPTPPHIAIGRAISPRPQIAREEAMDPRTTHAPTGYAITTLAASASRGGSDGGKVRPLPSRIKLRGSQGRCGFSPSAVAAYKLIRLRQVSSERWQLSLCGTLRIIGRCRLRGRLSRHLSSTYIPVRADGRRRVRVVAHRTYLEDEQPEADHNRFFVLDGSDERTDGTARRWSANASRTGSPTAKFCDRWATNIPQRPKMDTFFNSRLRGCKGIILIGPPCDGHYVERGRTLTPLLPPL